MLSPNEACEAADAVSVRLVELSVVGGRTRLSSQTMAIHDSQNNRDHDLRRRTIDDLTSSDAVMNRCLELAKVAAQTDLPILILGETGTGKTLLARAIHNSSKRASAPFVSFNAAALSDTLMDSQLFGHEKGAFTGAHKQVKGKFEVANSGTLFIDEIADMTIGAQAKILRALEYGEFERLGSDTLHCSDVRLISATHLPLQSFVNSNQFRKDLFYRLSGITIILPPLRDRRNDLPSLVAAAIAAAGRAAGKSIKGLEKDAAELVFSHHWPGNLRELDRVIRAAVSLTPGSVIPVEAILIDRIDPRSASAESSTVGSVTSEEDLTLAIAERRHIRMVMARMKGNKRRAAKALGVSRSTLDRKLGR